MNISISADYFGLAPHEKKMLLLKQRLSAAIVQRVNMHGMTQTEMARVLGFKSQGAVSKMMSGKRTLGWYVDKAIAMGVSVEIIIDG